MKTDSIIPDTIYSEENCRQFQNIIMQLATSNPSLCHEIMRRVIVLKRNIPRDGIDKTLRNFGQPVPVTHGKRYAAFVEGGYCPKRQDELAFLDEEYQVFAEVFPQLCERVRTQNNAQLEWRLQKYLRDLYQCEAARAILFLLKRADEETVREFALSYLGQEHAAQIATVDIIVRENEPQNIRGNLGHYVIYTRKGADGEEQLLKFTNQSSTVYYLMFLIHRCQPNRLMPYAELRSNFNQFLELYKQVYDEHLQDFYQRASNLLYRKDESGKMRAGRLHEIIYDIRKHLEERFADYGESFQPYAMTAKQHLTIGAEHIHFEGEAQRLLSLEFV